jgi:chitinase
MLSLGGSTYTQGGCSSTSDAQAAASVDRPFGTAVVDGFDFDFESSMNNLGAFAAELRSLMDAATSAGSKPFYLSAAPQCVYPDASDSGALQGEVYFDFVQVQFYNNFCGVDNYTPGTATQNAFNFDVWDNWAHTVSKNPDVKVLLGIPANTGAGGGYVSGTQLADVIAFSKEYTSFGGVMMWDMSQLYANTGFLSAVSSDLSGAPATTIPPTSTSTAPPSSTSTSTGGSGGSGGTVAQWGQVR